MGALDKELFDELSYYTLEHKNKRYFIHQHIVDAYTAQNAEESSTPISIAFPLIGLYLYLVRNYSGRQVQLAHMKLVKSKKILPFINLPKNRGEITVSEVLSAPPGNERDIMIRNWCNSVWMAYEESHESIASYVKKELEL
jgi:hypothetical protein